MLSLPTIALLAVSAGGANVTLLDFTSPYCGPCRTMAPTIARLGREGYPIRKVDVSREQNMAAKYGVRSVPCLIWLANGREIGRQVGAANYNTLVRAFKQAGYSPVSNLANTNSQPANSGRSPSGTSCCEDQPQF